MKNGRLRTFCMPALCCATWGFHDMDAATLRVIGRSSCEEIPSGTVGAGGWTELWFLKNGRLHAA